jgi:predicted DNA-binding protein
MDNNKQQDTTVYSLRLPRILLSKLEKMASRESRTVSNLMRLILEKAAK